ncbi:MAG: hypothetical protein KGL95_06410 [Patescibacteria group bacterium]|nr:hypothetical protein [Patescibacteria group bacterium]
MFKNLLNFKVKRTGKQAIGFYLAFLLFNSLFGAALALTFAGDYNSGVTVGAYGALLVVVVLSVLILRERKRYKSYFFLVFVVVALILTRIGGSLLGLIPLAYLTTK